MDQKPFGVLILHGFASSLDSVRAVESALLPLGYSIHMPILRGHGAQSPEALRGTTWNDWLADAEASLDASLAEAKRIIVIGHSMGGLLALNLAADHPEKLDSIVLVAAALQLASPLASGRPLHFLLPVIRRLFTRWDLPPEYTDKSLAQFDTNYRWAPMDAIISFLELSRLTQQRLPEVRVPAHILQSHKDTTTAPISADTIYQSISTPIGQRHIVWFEKSSHEMLQDCESASICGNILDYVRERTSMIESPVTPNLAL
jgi:carboxylesterase